MEIVYSPTVTDLAGNIVSDLKVGDEIKVATLFGWYRFFVQKVDEKYATCYTKSGKFGVWLNFNSKEGKWEAGCSFNPEAICKVKIVD